LLPLLERWCGVASCGVARLPYAPESAASLDWKFAQLRKLAASEQPLFVFAHLTLPHEPYIYDADCRHVRPYWPPHDHGAQAERVKAAYIAQLQCLNRQLKQFADAFPRNDGRPAVIMLQSDHGHGRLGRVQPPLDHIPRDHVEERLDIFAAYRLPGAPDGVIHDSIGPVNALRAVLRHFYGMDLPPLEEASYWSSGNHPYRFTRLR
jgi:phosphoglycerol transferase MdoB-like AlkP superfamily enzyme